MEMILFQICKVDVIVVKNILMDDFITDFNLKIQYIS